MNFELANFTNRKLNEKVFKEAHYVYTRKFAKNIRIIQ